MIKNLEINERLEKYISDHSYDLHPIQKEILKYNEKLGQIKKMQISISQAYFFQLFIKANKIKKILEIGTFTGFSALSMGLVIPKEGNIICLDINKKTSEVAKNFFKKANLEKKIQVIVSPAIESLKILIENKKKFDMVFIDANKENYKNYYNLSLELINQNGYIIIDNVLWKGEVADPNINDELTSNIREFNSFIRKDDRIEKTILPLGDGVTICRKI
tara:strand:+ start:754 stop:1410 length:657 start_codon:yes stop_codon:yes gene_type:complete